MIENCRNGGGIHIFMRKGKGREKMKFVVVDFEMNPVSSIYKEQKAICTNEIIQIGAVLLDDNYEELDSFQTYVKPCFCAKLEKTYRQADRHNGCQGAEGPRLFRCN